MPFQDPTVASVAQLLTAAHQVREAFREQEHYSIDPSSWLDMMRYTLEKHGYPVRLCGRSVIGLDHPPTQAALEVATEHGYAWLDEKGLDANAPTDRFVDPGQWEPLMLIENPLFTAPLSFLGIASGVDEIVSRWQSKALDAATSASPLARPRPRV